MNSMEADTSRRFYRDADRAVLGGVCAGFANHFDCNLKTTRFLAFIAFLMAMPIAVVAYLAVVFLIPAAAGNRTSRRDRKRQKKQSAKAKDRPMIKEAIERRCQTLDERLIRLEKHVTSRRFQLEQEFNRL